MYMSMSYESKTVVELKALAKEKGLSGYSKLRKQELIELLAPKKSSLSTSQIGPDLCLGFGYELTQDSQKHIDKSALKIHSFFKKNKVPVLDSLSYMELRDWYFFFEYDLLEIKYIDSKLQKDFKEWHTMMKPLIRKKKAENNEIGKDLESIKKSGRYTIRHRLCSAAHMTFEDIRVMKEYLQLKEISPDYEEGIDEIPKKFTGTQLMHSARINVKDSKYYDWDDFKTNVLRGEMTEENYNDLYKKCMEHRKKLLAKK